MNANSASRAEAHPGPAPAVHTTPRGERVLVWDLPVRVFHWLAVVCVAGAWITAESERWRLLHVTLGLTLAGLVAFRVGWGLVGTRHARFVSFVRGPRAVLRYLGGLWRGQPEHHLGHNPAGALAIVGLLVVAAALTGSGWLLHQGVAGDALEDVHEAFANGLLALVAGHVLGVVVSSWLHRENLVGAMLTGRKRGDPAEGVRRTGARAAAVVAALMLAAVLGFWWQQARTPTGGPALVGAERAAAADARSRGRGDDGGHDRDRH